MATGLLPFEVKSNLECRSKTYWYPLKQTGPMSQAPVRVQSRVDCLHSQVP